MAQDEGPLAADGLLGRTADSQVVLTRDVLAALRRLNPGLSDAAYAQALEIVVQNDSTKTLVQISNRQCAGQGGMAS